MLSFQHLCFPSLVSSIHVLQLYDDNIPRHTSVLGTLTLTQATVSSNSAGSGEFTGTGTGVHSDGLSDNKAILDEFFDGLTRVGIRDLIHLIRVEPDLAFTATNDGRRKALLGAKIDPIYRNKKI